MVCNLATGPLDFQNSCIRASWSAVLPGLVVLLFCVAFLVPSRAPKSLPRYLAPFQGLLTNFLTLHEAEALEVEDETSSEGDAHLPVDIENVVPLWRTVILTFIALVETLLWLAIACFSFVVKADDVWGGLTAVLIALTWLYATCRPIIKSTPTPPYDLFALYIIHLTMGIIVLGGAMYDRDVQNIPLPSKTFVVGLVFNLLGIICLLVVTVTMPLGIPSNRVKKRDIGATVSPEDYTLLWNWISFAWVYPLIKKGTSTTLSESDVWNLSPTFTSRPLFLKFLNTAGDPLLRRLWIANSRDLILDFFLTYTSIAFAYAGPYFLKKILNSIDKPDLTREDRSNAYVFAVLAFFATLIKGQLDAQHLWLGRRAATRIRSELMASLYDKALKRKDFSGIIDQDKQKEGSDKKQTNGSDNGKDQAKLKDKPEDIKANEPRAGANVGKIVNLMSTDANRIAMIVSGIYYVYGAPFEIIVATVFLYQLLGWSALAGYAVLLASWPLNSFMMKRAIKIQKSVATARDKRMQVVSELLGSVKFIKFFAWEDRWIKRALEARQAELAWLVKSRIISVAFWATFEWAPIAVTVISFLVFILAGNEMTVSIAFTSITLFNMVREPLTALPAWIIQLIETKVSLDRIAAFLDEEEVTDQVSTLKRNGSGQDILDGEDSAGLGISNASFKWNEVEENKNDPKRAANEGSTDSDSVLSSTSEANGHRFELRDIDVQFPEGELTLITGPTASGKTALLMAVLGEMTLLPGGRIIMSKFPSKVDEHGFTHSISYAAQTPWLRHQSIKDNIIFGYPFDAERYNQVVECCALQPDLDQFEDGDRTEIGARGVSLSGGQKARVALARAVYARTKYILLDDPLSAVDSHTSRFLFDRLFQGPLMANRTVVLVTHHIELVLPGAYYLVRMLDGRIDTQGTIKDLRARGLLESIKHDEMIQVKTEESAAAPETLVEESGPKPATEAKTPRKLIEDEHREVGGVKWSIYKTYLEASSYWTWGILAVLIIFNELLGVAQKVWMGIWGAAYRSNDLEHSLEMFSSASSAAVENQFAFGGHFPLPQPYIHSSSFSSSPLGTTDLPRAQEHPLFYVGIYALIGAGTGLTNVTSVIVLFIGALRASRLLFRRLLVTVTRATMRWHDTTPQGRMLNRFGKDVETIDTSLARSLQNFNSSLANFFAAILTVAYFFPAFLIPAFLIGLIYRQIAIGYLNTGRDLRRMESNSRSPLFSEFGELLEGIVTVRAFSAERRFLDDLHGKIDATTKMWYTFWMTNRWLLLNFDALGALAILITTLFALSGFVSAGIAGLCITSAMTYTMSIYFACRFWTNLELDLNSVERVVEYLELPQEPDAIIESNRPPAYWPSSETHGSLLDVDNLVIRYAPELPAVLHGVSFKLQAKERVGLLGRTGSGKSTLAMSIMRFVEPAAGKITIDGIDISTIGVSDLRSRLVRHFFIFGEKLLRFIKYAWQTFIPQDAILFSGTLRDNLDPFGDYDDSECLEVLYRVQLISQSAYNSQRASREPSRAPSILEDAESSLSTAVASDTDTKISLDTQISTGGTNFSQGQRQLIAMARALLRRSSVIILDEATSSIDFATDAKIQATIREEFNQSLLLTIAHRLRTVIDYDRLIVLDNGRIAEFDTPFNLIQKEDGIFRNMCLKSGTFGELEAEAKAKAQRDRTS